MPQVETGRWIAVASADAARAGKMLPCNGATLWLVMLGALCRDTPVMSRIWIQARSPEVCGMAGKQETLNEAGGLTDQ